jgi:hypothetical protein
VKISFKGAALESFEGKLFLKAAKITVVAFLAGSLPAAAAPAVRLLVTNDACRVLVCPPGIPPAPTLVQISVFTLYVAAVDGAGRPDTATAATVQFSSTDPLAILPTSFTFGESDHGIRVFVYGGGLQTLGPQTITVTDAANKLEPALLALTVTATPLPRLVVSAPCTGVCPGPADRSGVTAGEFFTVFVGVQDGVGGLDRTFIGTVRFASTDPFATLPPTTTLVPADQGTKVFAGGTSLRTPGIQAVFVRDDANRFPPGVLVLTVFQPALAEPIPTLGGVMKILLASVLLVVGLRLCLLKP